MRTWTISTPTHSKTLDDHEKQAAEPVSEARMDNLTLARKEGWQRFVDTPARLQPGTNVPPSTLRR